MELVPPKNENKPPHEAMKSRCLTGRLNFERLPLRNKNGEKLKAFAIFGKRTEKNWAAVVSVVKKIWPFSVTFDTIEGKEHFSN